MNTQETGGWQAVRAKLKSLQPPVSPQFTSMNPTPAELPMDKPLTIKQVQDRQRREREKARRLIDPDFDLRFRIARRVLEKRKREKVKADPVLLEKKRKKDRDKSRKRRGSSKPILVVNTEEQAELNRKKSLAKWEKEKARRLADPEYAQRRFLQNREKDKRKLERLRNDPVKYELYKERMRRTDKLKWEKRYERIKNDPELLAEYKRKNLIKQRKYTARLKQTSQLVDPKPNTKLSSKGAKSKRHTTTATGKKNSRKENAHYISFALEQYGTMD